MSQGQTSQPRWKMAHKNRPVYLMVSLFVLLLVNPAFEGMPFAKILLSALFTLVLISAALAVSRRRALFVTVSCLGLPWVVISWVNDFVAVTMAFPIAVPGFGIIPVSIMLRNIFAAL